MKDASGKYVGIGLGDVSPEVAALQKWLAKQYKSYAGSLVATGTYDQATANAVAESQRRLGLQPTGIADYAWKVKSGYVKPAPKPRTPFFTVEGHMSDMFRGPVADTASALEHEGRVTHLPTGYNSTAVPFDNKSGSVELENRVNQFAPLGTKFVVGGFSQGMIVVSDWLIDYVVGTPRERDILGVLAYGNPCRAKGSVAPWSRAQAGPPQNSGLDPVKRLDLLGISLPFPVMDVYRKGDIFADNEPNTGGVVPAAPLPVLPSIPGVDLSWLTQLGSFVGSGNREGDVKSAVYQAVARADIFSNQYSILTQISNLFSAPYAEVWAIFEAIVSGIGFLANQAGNPHYSPFNLDGGINWVRSLLP